MGATKKLHIIRKLIKFITPWGLIDTFQKYELNKNFKKIKKNITPNNLGYEDDEIAKKIYLTTQKLIHGVARYERDGILFDDDKWDLNVITSILYVINNSNNKEINIIDYGGGMGTIFYKNKEILEKLNVRNWSIVEQESFLEWGRKLKNSQVKFYDSISQYLKKEDKKIIDLVIISNVLQYLNKPYEVMGDISKYCRYILINKLPLSNSDSDIDLIQKVNPKNYSAQYPIKIFSKKNFNQYIKSKFEILLTANNDDEIKIRKKYIEFEYYWMLLKK